MKEREITQIYNYGNEIKMREWKIAQIYEIMNYTFAVGVAWDDPHVIGTFAGKKGFRLSLIDETICEGDSEIDYFSTEDFPFIASNYLVKQASSSHGKIYVNKEALEVDKENLKRYFYKTLQSLEI